MPHNQPERLGKIQSLVILFCLRARVNGEQDRWPLWIPVFFAFGIAIYFALPLEPPTWVGFGVAALGVGCGLVGHWRGRAWVLCGVVVALAAGGFAAASWRAEAVRAPVLKQMSGGITVTGTVILVEHLADGGGSRITLDQLDLPIEPPWPQKVRIKLRPAMAEPQVGQRVSLRANLLPPVRPAMAGAYDFPRKAWFMGLGATGMALSSPEVLEDPPVKSWRIGLNGVRQAIGDRVRYALPGASGGVAVAIMTGETNGIPATVADAYRHSGLAHILVIAGLHMGLLSGVVFGLVRGGLALWPAVALTQPIKKWAALAALIVTGFYMALAGFPVPASRAFIMAAMVLLAVMMDRAVISMRLWALASFIILALQPEQLVGASYQMSFAAVAALIASYEALGPMLQSLRRRWHGWLGHAALHMLRLGLTSLVAGSATMVYGLYHFNRIVLWQVLANLLAVPVVGVAVMPFALLSLLLMPLGLENGPLWVMGQGIDVVTDIGFWASDLPWAVITLPPLPVAGLAVFSLGGLWLCLWRGSWRWWGCLPMALGLLPLFFAHKPDLLVDEHGLAWGVRTEDGSLLINRGGRMIRSTWLDRAGPAADSRWPKLGTSPDGRLTCYADWCRFDPPGHHVALVKDEAVLDQACQQASILITAFPLNYRCPGPAIIIDRFDLWRWGAHALWLNADGTAQVENVAQWQGNRPWAMHVQLRYGDDLQDGDEE